MFEKKLDVCRVRVAGLEIAHFRGIQEQTNALDALSAYLEANTTRFYSTRTFGNLP
jgi:hypothetical protein